MRVFDAHDSFTHSVSNGTQQKQSFQSTGIVLYWLCLLVPGKLAAGDLGLIPELGISPGEGNGYPLQYSYLENPMDREIVAGYNPWGCRESDKTERLTLSLSFTRAARAPEGFTALLLLFWEVPWV